MDTTNQFICPHCRFQISNRHYPRCKGCGKVLPKELLYSTEELSAMIAQEARQAEARQREREAQCLAEKKRKTRINDDERLDGDDLVDLVEIFGDALGGE